MLLLPWYLGQWSDTFIGPYRVMKLCRMNCQIFVTQFGLMSKKFRVFFLCEWVIKAIQIIIGGRGFEHETYRTQTLNFNHSVKTLLVRIPNYLLFILWVYCLTRNIFEMSMSSNVVSYRIVPFRLLHPSYYSLIKIKWRKYCLKYLNFCPNFLRLLLLTFYIIYIFYFDY